jgi:hypothetical protein
MVAKLDDLGRPAWIAVMVAGFILFWPFGLAVLAYLIWSGRMGCAHRSWGNDPRQHWERKMARLQEKMDRWSARGAGQAQRAWSGGGGFGPTGNRAFDEYRSETLKRLEEEAIEFRTFLDRLRHAKDKAEFDQFMADRRNRPAGGDSGGSVPSTS